MFDCLAKNDPVFQPGKLWESLNETNIKQLESEGIENLKQTVATNYFTWVRSKRISVQFLYLVGVQYLYLALKTYPWHWPSILKGVTSVPQSNRFSRTQQIELAFLARMLWRFIQRYDQENLLQKLSEPEFGNPFRIYMDGKLISQDLGNSILEYYSIREQFKIKPDEKATVCELGGGYGRNAYVILQALPKVKYVMIDIPPALHVSQAYLSSVFGDRKIFHFRDFQSFKDIEAEYNSADIVFLLPHQARLVPQKSVDLFINISSLQEMTYDQVNEYFKLIHSLTKGYFYTKQWSISKNPSDRVILRKKDYPVPATWHQHFSRMAKVQVSFFEAMYSIR
jgi:putative sugar O-methyltransferase